MALGNYSYHSRVTHCFYQLFSWGKSPQMAKLNQINTVTSTMVSWYYWRASFKRSFMSEQTPLWKSVVAGGSAGVVEICTMYPLDVVKTRAQVSITSG